MATTITQHTYTITYGEGKQTVRKATTAPKAIRKLCEQYGWSFMLRQYDADSRGEVWAECLVDKNDGLNYYMRVVATRREI